MEELKHEQTNQEQTEVADWMIDELNELDTQTTFDGEKLPGLQFEENKIVTFTIDFSNKFEEYDDQQNKCIKAIIPVEHKSEKKILWLNKKNPLYKDIIRAGKIGQTVFSVNQTGSQANTKYNLVVQE